MCGETRRQPPGRHIAPDLLYFFLAVKIDEVDRELHADGVDGLTGKDPKTFSGKKLAASKQTFSARCAIVGNLHASSELGLPGEIYDFQPGVWPGVAAAARETVHDPAR
jgi:hypothetical protein